jgi:predicted anti-sigma-YlaC factor YlaD
MDFLTHPHPTQDEMELYAMHKAAEPVISDIEEHLLVCEKCRCELDSVEQQIRVMRIVLRDSEPKQYLQ